jgi:hypothetical protein
MPRLASCRSQKRETAESSPLRTRHLSSAQLTSWEAEVQLPMVDYDNKMMVSNIKHLKTQTYIYIYDVWHLDYHHHNSRYCGTVFWLVLILKPPYGLEHVGPKAKLATEATMVVGSFPHLVTLSPPWSTSSCIQTPNSGDFFWVQLVLFLCYN